MNNIVSEKYWLRQLAGELPVTSLPVAGMLSGNSGRKSVGWHVPEAVHAGMSKLTGGSPQGRFTFYLAVLNLLISKYTSAEDIIIRSNKYNQSADGVLLLRNSVKGEWSIKELLESCKMTVMNAWRHQDYSHELLFEQLQLNTGKDIKEICRIGFTDAGLQSSCDINIQLKDDHKILVTYNESYEEGFIIQLGRHFMWLATQCFSQISLSLNETTLFKDEEKMHLLEYDRQHTVAYISRPVTDIFDENARMYPEKIALYHGDEKINYRDVSALSDAWRNYLVSFHGVKKGDVVAVAMPSSPGLLLSILAVLKAGAVVLPIDPGLPEQRITYMVENSRAVLLLNETLLSEEVVLAMGAFTGSDMVADRHPEDLAFLVYTSGSTGHPKGAGLSHRNLCNHFNWFRSFFNFQADDVLPQKTVISFVDAILELLFPVIFGNSAVFLRPYDGVSQDGEALGEWLKSIDATIIQMVPSVFDHLVKVYDVSKLKSLKKLILSGEELFCLYEGTYTVYNIYGSSECCASSTVYTLDGGLRMGKVPIGKPIDNTYLYILNEQLQPVPHYMYGDIYVGGDNVGAGYVYASSKERDRFFEDPFHAGAFLYKTGDIGSRLPDGTVLYYGRNDQQIKIRGQRIDLSEITTYLKGLKYVKDAVVLARQLSGGEKDIIAAVSGISLPAEDEIRAQLLKIFPQYMLPSRILLLEKIPQTINGKVSREEILLLAGKQTTSVEANHIQDGLESMLVAIWQELLGEKEIGPDDNFFTLGGHSLKATQLLLRIRRMLHVDIQLQDIFDHPSIRSLSSVIKRSKYQQYSDIQSLPSEEHYALSHAQQRMFILYKLEGGAAYSLSGDFIFTGKLNIGALQYAYSSLLSRHEILRTTFRLVDGVPRQFIHPASEDTDMIAYEISGSMENTLSVAEKFTTVPFDLEKGPLIRAKLLQTGDEQYHFVLTMHHIITDAWSVNVMIREIFFLYNTFSENSRASLPPLQIQYKEYGAWYDTLLAHGAFEKARDYWHQQFDNVLPVLSMPADHSRPVIKNVAGGHVFITLDQALSDKLSVLGKAYHSTLFMTLLASLYAFIYRYTGNEDIIIGSVVSGRDHPDLEHQLGMYVNTIALRQQFNGDDSFEVLLAGVRNMCMAAYAHQDYPFDKLVNELNLQRDTSRSPLFDIAMTLNNMAAEDVVLSGIHIEDGINVTAVCEYDLKFNFQESKGTVSLQLDYSKGLFERATIERMLRHYTLLLTAIAEQPKTSLSAVTYLDGKELEQLELFNQTKVSYPVSETIQSLFEEQVRKSPLGTAIVYRDAVITYAALNEQANRLAHYLRKNFVTGPDIRIGVMMPHSAQLIVSLLGILKSGCAYVPIDPDYPEERIRYMLEDAAISAFIVDIAPSFDTDVHVVTTNDWNDYASSNPAPVNNSQHLAYVVYTSGSTGRPKGVMIEHHSVVNLCYWHISAFKLTRESRSILYAGIGFDACGWEIWPSLLSGGCLYPPEQEMRLNMKKLVEFLQQHAVTHCFLPTVICEQLMSYASDLSAELLILTGGDKLRKNPGELNIVNNYGPTEATVVATSIRLSQLSDDQIIPIGYPVSNTRIYILDKHYVQQPAGVCGEIYIGGDGLARGYLNQEQLTAEKFILHPVSGERLYSSGDLAFRMTDGAIVFMGRVDQQVKIRGHRIEPAEIEAILLQHEEIKEVKVIAASGGDAEKELRAYFTADVAIDASTLRNLLLLSLPDYMIPARFIQLTTFPLTPNGKADITAFPVPVEEPSLLEHELPVNSIESEIAAIWGSVPGMTSFGTNTPFFEAGGNSLKLIAVHQALTATYGQGIAVTDLFKFNTIKALSVHLQKSRGILAEIENIDV